ncbi:MAG: phosphoribosylformylglycinamidine cyclo-ligase [Synergistales bacterium]|nr:phosphoribosylformylglycinamidine cyclo-ligase [Synergistales bacterium]
MKNWTYEESGVTIEGGNRWVSQIGKLLSRRPQSPEVVGGIGGFSGLYDIGGGRLLAACCDGVGTKLEIARSAGSLKGLGQDLVAMSVNDLITCGAKPLLFLDYLACGKLDSQRLIPVVEGIIDGCADSDCVLLGGETAEMPDVYPTEGFDLAGFAVGIVDRSDLIDGSSVSRGDLLIGLHSSGIHSNGYSLVRKALEKELAQDLHSFVPELGETLAEAVLKPTRLYPRPIMAALKTGAIKSMAHITGGGLEENIARSLPEGMEPSIDYSSWTRPAIFPYMAARGIDESEMRKVFNLGIGFVMTAEEGDASRLMESLTNSGETPVVIGSVV